MINTNLCGNAVCGAFVADQNRASLERNKVTHHTFIYIWHIQGRNYSRVRAARWWAQQHICCGSWFNRGHKSIQNRLIYSRAQRIQMSTTCWQLQCLSFTADKDPIWCWICLIKEGPGQQSWSGEIVSQSVSLLRCKQGLWSLPSWP